MPSSEIDMAAYFGAADKGGEAASKPKIASSGLCAFGLEAERTDTRRVPSAESLLVPDAR